MGAILLFGLLAGLDNMQVAAGIGMSALRDSRKWALALAFSLFEALMPLFGLLLGQQLSGVLGGVADIIGPLSLAICGLLIMYLAWCDPDGLIVVESPWVLLGLPFSLSLDNLLAGIGFGAMGYPIVLTALVIGGISGCMCFLGIFIGSRVRLRFPSGAEAFSGIWLVIVALITVLKG